MFEQGLDKILKKCGEEECSEVIIAAKNGVYKTQRMKYVTCCIILLLMLVESGISLKEIEEILEQRRAKIGNLKQFHISAPLFIKLLKKYPVKILSNVVNYF